MLHGVGERQLTCLLKKFAEHGPCTRDFHYRGTNNKAVTMDETKRILRFLENIAETYALCLPGRVPGKFMCTTNISSRLIFKLINMLSKCVKKKKQPVELYVLSWLGIKNMFT